MPIKTKLTAMALTMLVFGTATASAAVVLEREPAELRLGQRVRVNDGTCPTGQVKEIVAAKATSQGVALTRTCVKK